MVSAEEFVAVGPCADMFLVKSSSIIDCTASFVVMNRTLLGKGVCFSPS